MSALPVLFLDFDGVLNWLTGRHVSPERWNYLDRGRVELVNQIVARTGCLVVVSSSWRKEDRERPRSHVNYLLGKAGATFHVYAVTPFQAEHDERCNGQGHADECGRGHEIQAWLDGEREAGLTVGPIAILDDGADMGHLRARLVQTDDAVGLTQEHVERVCALLSEPTTHPQGTPPEGETR